MKVMRGRIVLGLMSGTSHDGVDAALVSFIRNRPSLIKHVHVPYTPSQREEIASAFDGRTEDVCRLNFALGEVFAGAALKCMKDAGVSPREVEAVASHGQTIYHIPPDRGKKGSTLQIGEPAVIAQKTGVKVVSDFRTADMALGGQGAPLVPFADWVLFKHSAPCLVQNIGGIANVTVVTKKLQDVFAFDTGPGNCLVNDATQALFGKPFDRGGKIAKKGRPDMKLLERLLGHPYFAKRPPKSTGRETFGTRMLRAMITRDRKTRPEDIITTLTHLTARSISGAYKRYVFRKHKIREVILSGGGARNTFLVEILRDYLAPVDVVLMDEYGIPDEAKEAMSFAILANETLRGRPSSLPRVTGASRAAVLGKITPP
jgi:anhydro-N-acetylmuramic acid kinase